MKKRLLLLISLFFIPFMVNAKEYCRVIDSNEKTVGSEVVCGTEHFYIVENKNNEVSLLAKYNLNVGDAIDYFDIEGTKPEYLYSQFVDLGTDYCMAKANEKGYHPYYVYPITHDMSDVNYPLDGCRVYEALNSEHIKQDERAVGTKLDGNGKSILPLYGITYMNPIWGYDAIVNNNIRSNEYDSNGDLILNGTIFEEYLNGYKLELQRQDIDVSNVSFITVNKTLNLLKEISGRDVNVDLEYAADTMPDKFLGKMDIKEFTGKNKWIYDTTYWLGSGFKILFDDWNGHGSEYNDYYISNEGMLCALGRGECSYFEYPIGNGVRPLVTIPTSSMQFLIRTKTDGNGTIEVIDHAFGGDSIRFRVTSKKGYKLDSITIITDNGEKVSFREGEIQKNSDGTMSVDKNSFSMPFDNVTIEARWKSDIINPSTGKSVVLLCGFIILLSILIVGLVNKDKNMI